MISPRFSRLRLLALVLVGSLFVGGLFACGNSEQTGNNLEVVDPRLVETSNGDRSFTGTLVNHRSNTLSIAQIEVALYDQDGSRVETMRIEVEDIPPQDSVEFNETIDSDQAIQQAQVQSVLTP